MTTTLDQTERTVTLAQYGRALLDGDKTTALALTRDPSVGLGLLMQYNRSYSEDLDSVRFFQKQIESASKFDDEADGKTIAEIESKAEQIRVEIDRLQSELTLHKGALRTLQAKAGVARMATQSLQSLTSSELIAATFPDECQRIREGKL